jgi:leader peptidase (prepilin peptidase)/N-methyltransferase
MIASRLATNPWFDRNPTFGHRGVACRRRCRPGYCLSLMSEPAARSEYRPEVTWWMALIAVGLAVATVVRYGLSVNGVAWAGAQAVLVALAAYDIANRRIKNSVTIPVSLIAVLLRLAFERSSLGEVVVAGLVVFLALFALSIFLRGGLGMGDVKLAGMLGFLLGWTVLSALIIGTILGGIASAVVIFRSGSKRSTIAYGPYLAIGGITAILALNPPHLV